MGSSNAVGRLPELGMGIADIIRAAASQPLSTDREERAELPPAGPGLGGLAGAGIVPVEEEAVRPLELRDGREHLPDPAARLLGGDQVQVLGGHRAPEIGGDVRRGGEPFGDPSRSALRSESAGRMP